MKTTMKAAIFEGNGIITYKDIPSPVIEHDDEVILRVIGCSICGTDVHILTVPPQYDANPGVALGHELVGEVVRVGKGVHNVQIGDHAIIKPNIYCGVCHYCLDNMNNHCANMVSVGIHVNGGFAQFCKVKDHVCYKIDKSLDPDVAVFAEPLSCVLSGMKKLRPLPAQSILLIGAGPIGLMYLLALKACGANPVIVSEPNSIRRHKALELGADFVIDPSSESLQEQVFGIIDRGVDFAIDVVGSQISEAISCVKRRGTVLLFGLNTKAKPCVTQSDIVAREITVRGTYVDDATYLEAVDMLEKGTLNLKPLITHVLPLDKLSDGVELLRRGEGIKVIIKP